MLLRLLASTVAGAIVFYAVGFLLFGVLLDPIMKNYMNHFPGLMKEPMPDMLFLPLWNLAMAFLFAIVFEKWAGIRTFVGGLKGGFVLMLIIAMILDLNYVAFMNIYNGPVAFIIDVGAATALGTLAAGVVGAVLGMMNKSAEASE
ncbi:MAG: hypothetical protein ABJB40_04255 [Acidobacteriota bacterium]